ncbi:hypothetical protein L7F22_055493 [Adiantum nelumboides]|nr:hypothetical protein [Adiantum nelumboides]MCO5557546.1 hypothetical protein [Adiantum nelumboides]MCO5601373.1 hypothetical protein [Adiantum nelumboides]
MVPPRSSAEAVPMHKLFKHVTFHDGKLVQRPTPAVALMTLIWFPFGIMICLICMLICVNTPLSLVPAMYKLLGMKLMVRGSVPEAPEMGREQGEADAQREKDAANIKRLLETGHLGICPEGTTSRELVLLRFSALFAELLDRADSADGGPVQDEHVSRQHGARVQGLRARTMRLPFWSNCRGS